MLRNTLRTTSRLFINYARPVSNYVVTRVAKPKFASALIGATLLSSAIFLNPALAEDTPYWGAPGTQKERTFIAVKPDGVQRGLVGEVIQRFEKKGYKLVALKMVHPTKAMAEGHYDDLKTKPFFPKLTDYFSSGPIVAMIWEGPNAIKGGRNMLGQTNPIASAPGSIRGDYCLEMGRNLIHGSDAPDSAEHEIKFWFTEAEVLNYERAVDKWVLE